MGSPIKLENRSLNSIMNSMSFGVVTSKSDGTLKKSFLFDGLAQIRSKFSDDFQKANTKARTDFVNNLIKEFKLEDDSVLARHLNKLATGDNKTKPLSIRDAQKIITNVATSFAELKEKSKEYQTYNAEQLKHLAKQTLSDPKMFSEDIGHTSKGVLKNNLIKIRDEAKENPEPAMLKSVENWLRVGGFEPKEGLAKAILTELGLIEVAPKTKEEQEYEDFGERVSGMVENDYTHTEIMEFARSFASKQNLTTDDETVRNLLAKVGYHNRS